MAWSAGCETLEAIGSGEVAGKPKASNYNYSTPDRYRAGFSDTSGANQPAQYQSRD